jgi:putative hydrolase of the HAD superfamily
MKIKLIIFDLDDTLFRERDFVISGFRAVTEYVGRKYKTNKFFYQNLINIFDEQGRGKVFDAVLNKYGIIGKNIVNELVEVYRNHNPKIKLWAGGKKVLSFLSKKYILVLMTDGAEKTQKNKVKFLKIENFFKKIVYTDSYGATKPDTLLYIRILNKFKIKPQEVLAIGDNPEKDFIGAKSLGIKTARILKGEKKYQKIKRKYNADFNIKKLEDIIKILQKYEKGY